MMPLAIIYGSQIVNSLTARGLFSVFHSMPKLESSEFRQLPVIMDSSVT